jgi:regulator of sigma E protease
LRQILVGSGSKAKIGAVMTNSPADRAGLKSGDEIVKINGEQIFSIEAAFHQAELMTNSDAKPAVFTVKRGDELIEKLMLAEKPHSPTNAPPMFGIVWLAETNRSLAYPKPLDQIADAGKQIFATIGAVANKNTEIGVQQLGGAVMIIRVYNNFFQSEDGWRWVLWFSVVLNVNLALLNLLPLPVLDGGHILLSLIEIIRRRAASPKILGYIQSGFAILLITFMVWIAFFDIGDWIRSGRRDRAQPIIFLPK